MYKINILFCLFFLCLIEGGFAQFGSAKQVSWTTSAKKVGDKKYEVRLTATISGNYHLYAQEQTVEGPPPTVITYLPNPLLKMEGKLVEQGKKITKWEEAWPGNVNFYEKTVTFIQVINTKTKAKTNLNGKVEFTVCNDQLCLPTSEFNFKIPIGG